MAALHLPDFSINVNTFEKDIKVLLQSVKPQWNQEQIIIKKISGGYSCSTYLVHWENEPSDVIIVRVRRLFATSSKKVPIVDHSFETKVVEELSKLGFCAKVYAIYQNGYCYQYNEGKPLMNLSDKSKASNDELPIEQIAEKLAQIHSVSLDKCNLGTNSFFEELQQCLNGDYHEKPEIADKESLIKELNELIGHCKNFYLNSVLCHGDCHAGNMIWNSEEKKVTFVDWEFSHVGYQPFDIAYYFIYFHFPEMLPEVGYPIYSPEKVKEYESRFLQSYLQTWSKLNNNGLPVTESKIVEFENQVALFDLVCSLHMVIFCTALEDIDFGEFPADNTKTVQKIYEYYWKNKDSTLRKLKLK